MIFQEPMTALNPVFTIGWQIEEALQYHSDLPASQHRARAIEMLRLVEMPNPEKRIDLTNRPRPSMSRFRIRSCD